MTPSWRVRLTSRRKTEAFGYAIGQSLQGGEILALIGELGSGKTALVQGIAAGLGIPSEQVTSPTFTLIHEYQGRRRLVHIDLYRIDRPEAVKQLGLDEYYNDQTVVAIEWADRIAAELPSDRLDIELVHVASTTRRMTMTARGTRSQTLLHELRSRYRSMGVP